jgi:AraC family transcriptional regulator
MKSWQQVRKDLSSTPLAEGLVGGATSLYVEHYLLNDVQRTVSGISGTGLVTQFGGARVREGKNGAWRTTTLPSQSLLVPANCPTHWYYAGTVDFAVI